MSGLLFLMELARRPGRPASLHNISVSQGISARSMEQFIRPFQAAELIQSVRGPKGGYLLARKPESITVGTVLRLLDGMPEEIVCEAKPADCSRRDSRVVLYTWRMAVQSMLDYMDGITLADLELASPLGQKALEVCLSCSTDKGRAEGG